MDQLSSAAIHISDSYFQYLYWLLIRDTVGQILAVSVIGYFVIKIFKFIGRL